MVAAWLVVAEVCVPECHTIVGIGEKRMLRLPMVPAIHLRFAFVAGPAAEAWSSCRCSRSACRGSANLPSRSMDWRGSERADSCRVGKSGRGRNAVFGVKTVIDPSDSVLEVAGRHPGGPVSFRDETRRRSASHPRRRRCRPRLTPPIMQVFPEVLNLGLASGENPCGP